MRARPLVVLLHVLLGACPSSVAEPPAATGGVPQQALPEATVDPALSHAHERALKRLHDAALPALEAFDPVAAAALGRGPLRAPPVSRASQSTLAERLAPARREREGIDPAELSPEQAMLLRTLEHGTYRIDDELAGKTPLRTEPGAYLDRLQPLLALFERGISEGTLSSTEAAAVLQSIATELPSAATQLGGVSHAATAAAISDARALAERLRQLPAIAPAAGVELSSAAEDAAAKADALRETLEQIEARLADARPAERGAPLPSAALASAIRRLPDRLGAQALSAALSAEAITETPSVLSSRVVIEIGRLHAMADALPSAVATEATPITVERCEAAFQPIATWARTQPALAAAALDCAALVRRLEGAPLDDAALQIAVATEGVVVPTREARRREVDPALALVGGDITPHAQQSALTISVLVGAGLEAAASRAIERARDAACLSGAALVVHGEAQEGPLDVVGRLGAGCAHRTSEQWTEDVLARPRRSLRGLGFLLLGSGPADALAMQRFWWAPMGLVRPLSQPPLPAPPEPPAPTVKVEPLAPTTSEQTP